MRQFFSNLKNRFISWAGTRYGMDALSKFLNIACIVLIVLYMVLGYRILSALAYVCLISSCLRTYCSYTKYDKRRRELNVYYRLTAVFRSFYKMVKGNIKDKEHKYIICGNCRTVMRVPRNRGTLSVTCPHCGTKKTTKS